MLKKTLLTLFTILCLFIGCYNSYMFAGEHLNNKANVQMQKIAGELKEYLGKRYIEIVFHF